MKIIFAGTPEFAVPCLQALIDSEHEIIAVYTQPDRPAGRGRKLTPSPVKQLALKHNLPVHQPLKLQAIPDADLMVVVAYGLILPQTVLDTPKFGCINVHASLLPRWRGAAPIQRAILAGDTETGITIMQMDAGLDTGDIWSQHPCPIHPTDTAQDLHDRLAGLGAEALAEWITQQTWARHASPLRSLPQDNTYATYAAKLTKAEGEINWSADTIYIERQIRAFNPWPVAYTYLNGQTLRIWTVTVGARHASPILNPGTIIAASPAGIDVATGNGVLRLLSIQLPGGKHLTASEFLNAHHPDTLIGIQLGR